MLGDETLVVAATKNGQTYVILFDYETRLAAIDQAARWAFDERYNLDPLDAMNIQKQIQALVQGGE